MVRREGAGTGIEATPLAQRTLGLEVFPRESQVANQRPRRLSEGELFWSLGLSAPGEHSLDAEGQKLRHFFLDALLGCRTRSKQLEEVRGTYSRGERTEICLDVQQGGEKDLFWFSTLGNLGSP